MLFLKAIAELLSENARIEIVGCAGEADLATREIRRLAPHVVIIDFHLAAGNGIDVLKSVKSTKVKEWEKDPPLAIMFSGETESGFRKASLKFGADFVLNKLDDFEQLPQVLLAITSSRDALPAFADPSRHESEAVHGLHSDR